MCSTLAVCHTLGVIAHRESCLSSSNVLIYILGVQSWFPLHPWGADAQEELSFGYLLVDRLIFPPSMWSCSNTTWSLHVGTVVQWEEQGSALLKSPKTEVCVPVGTSMLATRVVGASALRKGLLLTLTNSVADTKARSKLECSLLH